MAIHETNVVRAFQVMALSQFQRRELRAAEGLLPPGMYLTGSDLSRKFNLQMKPLEDIRAARMFDLFREWEKKNWKKSQVEELAHDALCAGTPAGQWCKCRTTQQELWEWDEYATANWREPFTVSSSLVESL